MNKQEFDKEIIELSTSLKDYASTLLKLNESLNYVTRPSGDVTFSAIDQAKEAKGAMQDAKVVIDKIHKALKARATARMKEI